MCAATGTFSRRIVKDGERTLIQSTCTFCGAVLVGSVYEGLALKEHEHWFEHSTAQLEAAD